MLRRPPVCLEVWVRLRSYRGCPVLAAAAGYRLGVHCYRGGHLERSDGALVFAGPFRGRAYISERPVPLGVWVHLAGLEGSLAAAAVTPIAPARPIAPAASTAPVAPAPRIMPVPPIAPMARQSPAELMAQELPIPAAIAFDGRDVTAGRLLAQADPLPLGYDPWEEGPAEERVAKTLCGSVSASGCRGPGVFPGGRERACRDVPESLDGEIGTWRLSRGWRSLAQVAAARGSPWRLAPLPPPRPPRQELAPGATAAGGSGGITGRGWRILAAGLLLALAMVAAGMALRRRPGGPAAVATRGGALERLRVRGTMERFRLRVRR